MKIAAVQMDVSLADPIANVDVMIDKLRETTTAGAALTIFPECAVTGYCFDSLEEGMVYGESIPGPSVDRMISACQEMNCYSIFGMLESDAGRLFNAAVLVGPDGFIGSYRKVHLPYLGIDRFTTYGDRPFEVFQMQGMKVGMLICYDVGFPEAARTLALQGADLVVLPTNWPPGAECMAEHSIPSRAMENSIYFAAVNRVGTEQGFRFIGRSSICGPSGEVLSKANHSNPEILYAEIHPERARNKRIIRVPEKHLIDRFADRRPEMYDLLTKPHELRTPRQDREGM